MSFCWVGRNAQLEGTLLFFLMEHVYNMCITLSIYTGINASGKKIFLQDIWPTRNEIQAVERQFVIPGMFKEVYQKIEAS